MAISLWLLPLYVIGRLIWYRPPNVPHFAQVQRYLRLTWTVQPPAPGLSGQARIWLTLSILRKWLATPINGVAWLLDELLYGRALNATDIVAPLFVISGGRSGSTQITRYLEADPSLTAPSLLQCMFPYLWAWKLAPVTLGRFFSAQTVRAKIESMLPPELLERHESDPFKADTFDVVLFSAHLNMLGLYLGPEVSAKEFNFATFAAEDRTRLEQSFVQFVDRIGRKQHLFIGDTPTNKPRRLFIKGHFLNGADALAQRYPDATFLTLIRDPAKRLQSSINFIRVNPTDPVIGPPPWAWISASLLQSESEYCRLEQAWYTEENTTGRSSNQRHVVRFADFVNDLEGTMQQVYRVCLDQDELPPHVPRTHPPRERKNYSINYSLAELGVDSDALRTDLAAYINWVNSNLNVQ
ncbi:MAG: sulfotransferase [Candidatus Promineifilaceae bacterium]